jgi:hypothetical protein
MRHHSSYTILTCRRIPLIYAVSAFLMLLFSCSVQLSTGPVAVISPTSDYVARLRYDFPCQIHAEISKISPRSCPIMAAVETRFSLEGTAAHRPQDLLMLGLAAQMGRRAPMRAERLGARYQGTKSKACENLST